MIALAPAAGLSPRARFGRDLLVDLSRVVPVAESDVPVVRLETIDAADAGDWDAPPYEVRDGTVSVPAGFLERIASVAGATEEQQSRERDAHGRVPPEENELVRTQEADRPVLNLAAAALRRAVRQAATGGPFAAFDAWPEGRDWAVTVTHDVDVVQWWGLFAGARLAELLRAGRGRLALSAAAAALRSTGGRPALQGIRDVLAAEAARGLPATWFFLCDDPSLGRLLRKDTTYRPEARDTREALDRVRDAGHEIGLHGSLESGDDEALLSAQRTRLAGLCGQPIHSVRQHFLRMRPGATPRHMAGAGFRQDATCGFADRSGFRLGAADLVPLWDAEREERSGIDELPLHWMDRTESKYRGVEEPRRWITSGLASADAARAAGGVWSFVWHPYLTGPLGFPGAPAAFGELLDALREREPHFARIDELAEWRRRRRSLSGVLRGQALRLHGDPGSAGGIGVVDGSGHRRVIPVEASVG